MMKKIIALILTGMMILPIAACGAAKAPESAAAENTEENSIVGGYERTDSAALKKATEKLLGAEYTPEALVATQVVSGTNYCILCTVMPVSPKGEPSYNLVYVYRDLKGNAEIKDTVEFHA